ncbi:hypothetical protein ACJZ2D_000131 [Fusarium nematophilum]
MKSQNPHTWPSSYPYLLLQNGVSWLTQFSIVGNIDVSTDERILDHEHALFPSQAQSLTAPTPELRREQTGDALRSKVSVHSYPGQKSAGLEASQDASPTSADTRPIPEVAREFHRRR